MLPRLQGPSALTLQGELVLRIVAAQDIANPPSGSALGQPTWLLQLTDGAECCTAFEWSPLPALHEAGADQLLAVGAALRLINCRVSGGILLLEPATTSLLGTDDSADAPAAPPALAAEWPECLLAAAAGGAKPPRFEHYRATGSASAIDDSPAMLPPPPRPLPPPPQLRRTMSHSARGWGVSQDTRASHSHAATSPLSPCTPSSSGFGAVDQTVATGLRSAPPAERRPSSSCSAPSESSSSSSGLQNRTYLLRARASSAPCSRSPPNSVGGGESVPPSAASRLPEGPALHSSRSTRVARCSRDPSLTDSRVELGRRAGGSDSPRARPPTPLHCTLPPLPPPPGRLAAACAANDAACPAVTTASKWRLTPSDDLTVQRAPAGPSPSPE
mmetsp:Transcript_25435/g.76934  ORF Transcript_25435/g.76934 Transcript_25435/m.76934 type:complete len:388 (+) Transcript_25435:101-1264(+)